MHDLERVDFYFCMIELTHLNRLIDSGFSLICIGEGKRPNHPWKDNQTKAFSKEEFAFVYHDPTTKGYGIVTGFNGLEVVDIDLKILPTLQDQQDFWNEFYSLLCDNIADFEEKFVIYKTINNGYHILYRCEQIEGNKKLAKLKGHKEAIIETRGTGGYVFIYTKRVSKNGYTAVQEVSLKDREVLLSICRMYDYKEPIKIEEPKTEYNEQEITPWADFNNKNNVWDIVHDEFEIIRSIRGKKIIRRHGASSEHSGYIYDDSGLMYLFSTGTHYPHETPINPFQAYTYRYHHGDFSASAKDVYLKGYGTRIVKQQDQPETIQIDQQMMEFPLDIFPEAIQSYLIQCNTTLNSSIDYMGCSMLWMLSLIVGNSIKVQVKTGWVEAGILWIALVGRPGVGKTPNINNVIFPLQKANNNEIKKYIDQMDRFKKYQSLDKGQKEVSEEISKPSKTQFIASDITIEALVELHEENKNAVAVFKDELAGWLKDMNKYRAGSDLEFWLSSWSNKGIALNRKTAKSSFVESPVIPILGGVQPGILNQFYTEENKDNGFVDRILTCFPHLDVEGYNDNEMDQTALEWFEAFIIKLYRTIKDKVIDYDFDMEIQSLIAKFSPEAKEQWKRIFNEITEIQNSNDENEYMKSMLPKQKSYIPRFALLIHVLDCYYFDSGNIYLSNVLNISEDSILKAERLSKYFINMAKKIKIQSSEFQTMKTILKEMQGASNKEKTLAVHKINPDFNRTELAELLNVTRRTIINYLKEV